jgi:hypothetical protein
LSTNARLHARERRLVHDAARLVGRRQEQQDVIGLGEHAIRPARGIDARDMRHGGRIALGADDPHAQQRRQSRDLGTDGAQPENPEGGPGQRGIDAPPPATRGLVEDDGGQILRAEQEPGEDVLGHLHAVRAARAGEDCRRRHVGREPLLAAARERLDPSETRRAGREAGRWPPGQERVGAGEQRVGGLGLERSREDLDGRCEPGRVGRPQVVAGLVEPDQDGRGPDWGSVPRRAPGRPPRPRGRSA